MVRVRDRVFGQRPTCDVVFIARGFGDDLLSVLCIGSAFLGQIRLQFSSDRLHQLCIGLCGTGGWLGLASSENTRVAPWGFVRFVSDGVRCREFLAIAIHRDSSGAAGGDEWNNGVAMQTSWATCSPAAAATLLRAEGINKSESEMIPLCLTDSSGTPTLGLYRGIKLVADGQNRSVNVLDETLDEMWNRDDWPVLMAVELPYGVDDRRYVDQWGWIPGMGHSVVALGLTSDGQRMLVGDPSVGLEQWSKDDLRVLWHGNGIRLE